MALVSSGHLAYHSICFISLLFATPTYPFVTPAASLEISAHRAFGYASGFSNAQSECGLKFVVWLVSPVFRFLAGIVRCLFIGAFAELRKATISVVMIVCLSVRMESLVSHWTDFHEI